MEKREYKTIIDASPLRVWEVLWGEVSYKEWTSVFAEGSRAETDWQEGSKVYFLSNCDDGMVAIIQKKTPNKYMSFKHIGVVKNGVEDFDSEEVRKWAGSTENYTLKEQNGKTELIVDMDIDDAYLDYFESTWPKAMAKLKDISEEEKALKKS